MRGASLTRGASSRPAWGTRGRSGCQALIIERESDSRPGGRSRRIVRTKKGRCVILRRPDVRSDAK